jgi:1-acyl-sn-glycerol-3-phosphate acyltransferase
MTGSAARTTTRADRFAAGLLPPRWPWLFRLFRRYARRYVARHFHAVRVSRAGLPTRLDGPAVMVLNHPSWWDPLLCYVLSNLWPDRVDWGVIDRAGLNQYRFLARAGLFGIEPGTARGAVEFLRTAGAVLAEPRATLWVTAQGRFADVRERPIRLRSGVGHLAATFDRIVVVPVALEYPFWDQRTPEALVRFGDPLVAEAGRGQTAHEWTQHIAAELERTMDALAAEAVRRDPCLFSTILSGRAGVGGVYDLNRRMSSWLRGRRFEPEHRADEP